MSKSYSAPAKTRSFQVGYRRSPPMMQNCWCKPLGWWNRSGRRDGRRDGMRDGMRYATLVVIQTYTLLNEPTVSIDAQNSSYCVLMV